MLSLFAEDFQVAGFADRARVKSPIGVWTVGRQLLTSVQVITLLAVAARVELPFRVGTTSRKLLLLRLVRATNG